MRLFTRVTHAAVAGGQETTYDLGWFPIVVSAFAALGTFGNFALNLGMHFKWWWNWTASAAATPLHDADHGADLDRRKTKRARAFSWRPKKHTPRPRPLSSGNTLCNADARHNQVHTGDGAALPQGIRSTRARRCPSRRRRRHRRLCYGNPGRIRLRHWPCRRWRGCRQIEPPRKACSILPPWLRRIRKRTQEFGSIRRPTIRAAWVRC